MLHSTLRAGTRRGKGWGGEREKRERERLKVMYIQRERKRYTVLRYSKGERNTSLTWPLH